MGRTLFGVVCLFLGLGTTVQATDIWQQLGDQLAKDHKDLRAAWEEKQTWEGFFCEGSYHFKAQIGANLDKVKVELKDEGHLQVTANITGITALVDGAYRSKATLCLPQGGWLGVGSEWAELVTELHFGEEGLNDLSVKIVSTRLGTLNLGKFVPAWFENFTAGMMNRAMSVVWNSRIGNWINAKITQEVRKKIPKSEL